VAPSLVTVSWSVPDASLGALAGTITFAPVAILAGASVATPVTITDAADGLVIAPAGVTRQLGVGVAELIPTDNSVLSPAGWMYQITTAITGLPPTSQTVLIPHSPSPVDLSALVPAVAVTAVSPYATSAALAAEITRAEAAETLALPKSQSYAEVSGTYGTLFSVQATGGTDTVSPFQMAAGAGTYGGVVGPALFFGYNAQQGASKGSGAHGAAAISFFADAGDTNSSGAHGVEANITWFGPDGAGDQTGAFEMVAVNDTTNTVYTTIRCGSGSSGPYSSSITFENADASTVFMQMSNASSNVVFFQPVVFEDSITFIDSARITWPLTLADATGNSSIGFSSVQSGGAAVMTLNGTNVNTSSEIVFSESSSAKWAIEHTPPYLYIRDVASSRSAVFFYPGTTPANSRMQVNSVIQGLSSIVAGSAALATTATDGFLYLPSCAGAPTGVPTTWTGTVPCVFDTTDAKIYFYTGGAWVGLAD
jgi:hypothetical protein